MPAVSVRFRFRKMLRTKKYLNFLFIFYFEKALLKIYECHCIREISNHVAFMLKNVFQTKHFTESNILLCVGQTIKQDLLLSIVYICTFSGSQMLVEHIHSDGYSGKIPV